MDLVFLSVLVGVAMAIAARLFWGRSLPLRFLGILAFAEGAAMLVTAGSGLSPFYFVSSYLMMAIFALLASLVALFYAGKVLGRRSSGPYSLKIMLGLLIGLIAYLGYWGFLVRTGLVEELPVAPRQVMLAFAALGLLIILGFSATSGIIRTYWPPPEV